MENEGPYRTGDATCIVFRVGVGEAENFDSERDALNASRLANTAYAEGRKSMEKEFSEKENHEMKEKCSASWNSGFDQCMQLMKRELGWQEAQNEKRENEFNELLELANQLNSSYKYDYSGLNDIPVVSHKFEGWKKARGIE